MLSFLSLSLWACKKETSSNNDINIPYFDFKIYNPGNQERGSAKATVFDKEWNASASIIRYPKDTSRHFEVYFETYSDEGFTRDQISFGLFDGKVGEYQVTDNPFDNNFDDFSIHGSYALWLSDGDLLYGNYEIDTDFDNKVTIDKNDGNIVEGRFSLVFKERIVGSHTDIPSKIYFKNGKFQANL